MSRSKLILERSSNPLKEVNATSNEVDNDKIERQTFTSDEWKAFYSALRKYAPTEKEKYANEDKDLFARFLVRYFCLFGANSGCGMASK